MDIDHILDSIIGLYIGKRFNGSLDQLEQYKYTLSHNIIPDNFCTLYNVGDILSGIFRMYSIIISQCTQDIPFSTFLYPEDEDNNITYALNIEDNIINIDIYADQYRNIILKWDNNKILIYLNNILLDEILVNDYLFNCPLEIFWELNKVVLSVYRTFVSNDDILFQGG